MRRSEKNSSKLQFPLLLVASFNMIALQREMILDAIELLLVRAAAALALVRSLCYAKSSVHILLPTVFCVA